MAKGGSLTLPAKKLYEIIKALPETDVRIEEDKGGVKVAADRFDSRMQTLPREDFPTLPEATGTASATLPREALRQMVAKTQFAITGEDTRYFLNGALFILRAESMSLVSTDGHRLALITVPREKRRALKGDEESRVILPRKTLLELGRLLPRATATSTYERGENHLFFDVGGRAADLTDDRRTVPGLRAGHSEEQRQARRVRSRSADQRGQARSAALERTIARGEVRDRQRQGGDRLEQSGVRRGEGSR